MQTAKNLDIYDPWEREYGKRLTVLECDKDEFTTVIMDHLQASYPNMGFGSTTLRTAQGIIVSALHRLWLRAGDKSLSPEMAELAGALGTVINADCEDAADDHTTPGGEA